MTRLTQLSITHVVAIAYGLLTTVGVVLLVLLLLSCAPGPRLDYCAQPGNVQLSTTCEGR